LSRRFDGKFEKPTNLTNWESNLRVVLKTQAVLEDPKIRNVMPT